MPHILNARDLPASSSEEARLNLCTVRSAAARRVMRARATDLADSACKAFCSLALCNWGARSLLSLQAAASPPPGRRRLVRVCVRAAHRPRGRICPSAAPAGGPTRECGTVAARARASAPDQHCVPPMRRVHRRRWRVRACVRACRENLRLGGRRAAGRGQRARSANQRGTCGFYTDAAPGRIGLPPSFGRRLSVLDIRDPPAA